MDGGAWNSDRYQDSIVRLYSIALATTINIMTNDARIWFHPLVAEWLKLRIDQVARAQYAEEAIRYLSGVMRSSTSQHWNLPTGPKMTN